MTSTLVLPDARERPGHAPTPPERRDTRVRGIRRGGKSHGILALVVLGAVSLAVAAVLGWDLSGGRFLVMETPSMCPSVCVGSLVADRPLQGAVHPGELITFHPPHSYTETYTHVVSRVFANGTIQTRGVANAAPDPWRITRSDIKGEVVFTVWELGWLLKALPLLAVGVFFWVTARPWIGERTRRSWDRGWMTVLAALPLWVLHPLVSASVIGTKVGLPNHRHWASDTVVNTGILPVSFRAAGGRAVHVGSTGVGHVAGSLGVSGSLIVHEAVSLPGWGWTVLASVVVSPLAGFMWMRCATTRGCLSRHCRGKLQLLTGPELEAGPVGVDPPHRLRPADGEAVAIADERRLLVDAHQRRVRRCSCQHPADQPRHPVLQAVEMGQDDQSRHDGQSLTAVAPRPAEVVREPAERTGTRRASCKSCARAPGVGDRLPDGRALKRVGQVSGIAARQVDEACSGDP